AGGADSSDAYALRVNPDNPNQYEWDGEYVPMEVSEETLRYRDGETIKEVVETIRYTRHGPVAANKQGELYAGRHGSWNHALAMEQFWRMNTARNTVGFKAALAMDRLSYFNVIWATTEGHIGYVQTGEVPRRSTTYDWEKRVPGWTSKSFLGGNIPFGNYPRLRIHRPISSRIATSPPMSSHPDWILQRRIFRPAPCMAIMEPTAPGDREPRHCCPGRPSWTL
ncbi:MAG: hypothetical protein GY892_15890, partial [Shimia sp.]|nr:hypothetical protein [Shimia sp.]